VNTVITASYKDTLARLGLAHLGRTVSGLFQKRLYFNSLSTRTIWTFLKIICKSL